MTSIPCIDLSNLTDDDNDDDLVELVRDPLHGWRESPIHRKRPRQQPLRVERQIHNHPMSTTQAGRQERAAQPVLAAYQPPAQRHAEDDDYDNSADSFERFDSDDEDEHDGNNTMVDNTALSAQWGARKHRVNTPAKRRPSSSDDSVTGKRTKAEHNIKANQDDSSTNAYSGARPETSRPSTVEQIRDERKKLAKHLMKTEGISKPAARTRGLAWAEQQTKILKAWELEQVKIREDTIATKTSTTQWPGSMGSFIRTAPSELQAHVPSKQNNTATQPKGSTPNSGNPTPFKKATTLHSEQPTQSFAVSGNLLGGLSHFRPSQDFRQHSASSQSYVNPASKPPSIPQVNQGIKRSADGRAKANPNFLLPEVQSRRYGSDGRATVARPSQDATLPNTPPAWPNATAPWPVPVGSRDGLAQEGLPNTSQHTPALTPVSGSPLRKTSPMVHSTAVPGLYASASLPNRAESSIVREANLTAVLSSYPVPQTAAALASSYPTSVEILTPAAARSTEALDTPSGRLPAFNLVLTPRTGHLRDHSKDTRIAELVGFFHALRSTLTPGSKATPEEDELVDLLKDYIGLTWEALGMYFPHRSTWHPLQSRYSERTRRKKGITPNLSHRRDEKSMSVEIVQSQSQAQAQAQARRNVRAPSVFEDTSMSEAAPSGPTRRPRRAAAEAKKPGAYTINRKSFGDLGEAEDDTTHDAAGDEHVSNGATSTMIQRKDLSIIPVTRIGDSGPPHDHDRLHIERERDLAATSSMLNKIARSPWVEKKTLPKQLRLHKRPSIDIYRPYLAYSERQYLQNLGESCSNDAIRNWTGKVLHTDFTDAEVAIMEPHISQVMLGTITERDRPLRQFVVELMTGATESQIRSISGRVQSCGVFINRTKISIESYLTDLANSQTHDTPSIARMEAGISRSHASKYLRRELGGRHGQSLLKHTLLHNTLGPSLVFKKASGDVTNVAWSPDGQYFAAGSAALMDSHSMQYNRRNNLLLGDRDTKTLLELPHHSIKREAPTSGANASHAMHESQDPLLYTSISAVKFSPDSTVLFTAGYDNIARVWDIRHGLDEPSQIWEFRHKAPLDLLEVNESGLFATGSKRASESIKVLKYDEGLHSRDLTVMSLASPKALERPELDITPSIIRWGPQASSQDKYLVAGFTSASKDLGGEGEMCVWDLDAQIPLIAQRGGKSVFDIAWSPSTFGRIAVASSPIGFVNRGTNSIVRIYDSFRSPTTPFSVNAQNAYELECPALDVNDVIFNSIDSNLITIGCTDGRVYIWDLRNPDQILHSFAHGKSLVELDQAQAVETIDTGIRFVHWGESERNLFSGSSDGVVALWNPYVSPEDAYVRKVIQLESSVMSGAFSPDFSNLLLGEEDGTITMLTVGCEDTKLQDCERFNYKAANADVFDEIYDTLSIDVPDQDELATEGRRAAKVKIDNDEVKWQPLAGFPRGQIVQGLNYDGPYDASDEAPELREKSELFQKKLRHNGNQCHLTHELPPLTEEEMGDSGAWKSRIPELLRRAKSGAASPLELTCFRCNVSTLSPALASGSGVANDVLECHDCRMAWRVDVLGFTHVDYYTKKPVRQLDMTGLEVLAAKMTLAEMKDDVGMAQNIESWAHSLWGLDT